MAFTVPAAAPQRGNLPLIRPPPPNALDLQHLKRSQFSAASLLGARHSPGLGRPHQCPLLSSGTRSPDPPCTPPPTPCPSPPAGPGPVLASPSAQPLPFGAPSSWAPLSCTLLPTHLHPRPCSSALDSSTSEALRFPWFPVLASLLRNSVGLWGFARK